MNDPRLFLHTSNRMEDLAAMLAAVIGRPGNGDPFQAETVLVQSRGMGRWLSLQLADAQRICLNVRFPFPREVIEEILAVLQPGWESSPGFRRETMVWKTFRLLETFRNDPRLVSISQYLEGGDRMKRIQLAERLAHLFDQYLVYRPDLLTEWERSNDPEDWQALLWKKLVEEAPGEVHFGRVWQDLEEQNHGEKIEVEGLPPRLFVFGISSLPPLFLRILRRYAHFGELHLFLLQPTGLYWGDLVSKKKQSRLAGGKGKDGVPSYLEEGHPLVASLGRQGQDLLNLLIDHDFQQVDAGERFSEPGDDSLLHQLQTDILLLTDRSGENRIVVDEKDQSIQIHSCHSPMREVEVLHDQLLDRFAKNPELRPRDVLVMIPDIEAYAPYIEAVFGSSESSCAAIPFSVVDRRPRSIYHAIDVWFRVIELAGGRFGAREVIALLESPPFQMRFNLTDRDTNILRSWIQATGIRWGIDGAHREEQGLPGFSETSWEAGIQQWLLGYAMRDGTGEPGDFLHSQFPFDEVEGGNIKLLNLFLSALDFLFKARLELQGERSLAGWSKILGELLGKLFGGVEEIAFETEAIRQALDALRKNATLAGSDEDLPLDVVRYFLEKTIDATVPSGGFLSGGVTFCTLQPMRTIPARIVCLLGMDDAGFPRRPQQLGFDRMRDERRVGDRSVREDDRYLFLETLLSARDGLILSYVGQSARDLSEAPPSVLVSELMDHLTRACQFGNEQSAPQFLLQRHRLQSFHQDYFIEGKLFSYSMENAEACRRLMGERASRPNFITGVLPDPEEALKTVEVRHLIRFFRNPAEYFLRERLGLRLPQEDPILEDSEMFFVGKLDEYALKQDAVRSLIEHRDSREWRRFQVLGKVPLGAPGIAACHAIERQAQQFAGRVIEVIGDVGTSEYRHVDHQLDGFHLRGELGPFYGDRLVLYRPANLKPKDCLAAWIHHLLASWITGGATQTVLMAQNRTVILPAREDANERILELLGWYWRGLREPLPFFPLSAYAYQKTLHGKRPDTAADVAREAFEGGAQPGPYSAPGDIEDSYVRLCWGGDRMEEALGSDFEIMAKALFQEIELFEEGDGG